MYLYPCPWEVPGKSLCYAVLPMAHDNYRSVHVSTPPDGGSPAGSIVLVISPLISLIDDQVRRFTAKGLKSGFLGMDMNSDTFN